MKSSSDKELLLFEFILKGIAEYQRYIRENPDGI